jgi:putative tryptophan/tyrosine transport system substrate-binding protein
MRRREFIMLLCGAAVAPLTAHAQQIDRMRRVGVLMAHTETDPEFNNYLNAFREGLLKLGRIEGRNIRIDTRWGALDDAEVRERSAKELLALEPDIILTQNTPPTQRRYAATSESDPKQTLAPASPSTSCRRNPTHNSYEET